MERKRLAGSICVFAAGCLWGLIGLFSERLSAFGFSTVSTIFFRALFCFLGVGIYICVKDFNLFYIKLKDIWMFIGMGVVSFTLFNLAYLSSMQLNRSLSTAAVLLYTAPMFVMLMSAVLFKEKITIKKLIALAVAVLGCALVSFGSYDATLLGIIVGLLSGLGYALYSIFSVFALRRYNTLTAVFYAFLFSAVATAPFVNLFDCAGLVAKNPISILHLLGIALISTLLPYLLYTYGLKNIEPSPASIICCIEPVVASLVGFFVFKQYISPIAVIGIAAVICSIFILNIKRKKEE